MVIIRHRRKLKTLFSDKLILKKNRNEFINIETTSAKIIENTRLNFKFSKDKYMIFRDSIKEQHHKIIQTRKENFMAIEGTVVPKAFWKDAETFEREGIGYSLFIEEESVSTAFSAFIHEDKLELGIETSRLHHGKGFGALTCSLLIDYCLSQNYIPVWSCRLENLGSVKLAQKLGFEPISYPPCFRINS